MQNHRKTPLLLTNDDGYDAPGLQTLWDCLAGMGFTQVQVAAPARGWSVRSHATTMNPKEPIKVTPLELNGMQGVIVDGFPADCTRVGLKGRQLFKEQLPVVIAGINAGANLGVDAFYSGTLAAAREAVALGCTAIALSSLTGQDGFRDWARTSQWTARILEWLLPLALVQERTLWNVNFPSSPMQADFPPVQMVPMSTDPHAVAFSQHRQLPDSLSYSGSYYLRPAGPGTDVECLFAGSITVTPMILDLTDYNMLKKNFAFP
jgi:5'-nucleotidase